MLRIYKEELGAKVLNNWFCCLEKSIFSSCEARLNSQLPLLIWELGKLLPRTNLGVSGNEVTDFLNQLCLF